MTSPVPPAPHAAGRINSRLQLTSGSYDENAPWLYASPSSRIGNLTSHEPTIFWILNSANFASKPNFWMIRAYLREARRESSSDFAPVTTILPEANMSAVVLGSRIRITTAANRLGLYSALRAWRAIVLRSSRHSRLTVATMFLW